MKTPEPIHALAAGFAPAVLAGLMTYGEVDDILMRIVSRYFGSRLDEIGRAVSETLTRRASELECQAADAIRTYVRPLIAIRAPKPVLLAAAGAASRLHAVPGYPEPWPYLSDRDVEQIVAEEVRCAVAPPHMPLAAAPRGAKPMVARRAG